MVFPKVGNSKLNNSFSNHEAEHPFCHPFLGDICGMYRSRLALRGVRRVLRRYDVVVRPQVVPKDCKSKFDNASQAVNQKNPFYRSLAAVVVTKFPSSGPLRVPKKIDCKRMSFSRRKNE